MTMSSSIHADLIPLIRQSYSLDLSPYGKHLVDSAEFFIKKVYGDYKSFLSPAKLAKLAFYIQKQEKQNLDGVFVEFGCALGGSSSIISCLKEQCRKFFVYDVFGMIPPPTEFDSSASFRRHSEIVSGSANGLGSGHTYYGYQDNLEDRVKQYIEHCLASSLDSHNVQLINQDIRNILAINHPVSFCHIDVDWYEPTCKSLDLIRDNLIPGSVILLDDVASWDGAKRAMHEFLDVFPQGSFDIDDNNNSTALIML